MIPSNLLDDLPAPQSEELFDTLTSSRHVRIERIVSWGQTTAPGYWYDQDWSEWVVLLQGQAILRLEHTEMRNLGLGDWVLIPAHCRHRVEWTSSDPPALWLAVHFRDE